MQTRVWFSQRTTALQYYETAPLDSEAGTRLQDVVLEVMEAHRPPLYVVEKILVLLGDHSPQKFPLPPEISPCPRFLAQDF